MNARCMNIFAVRYVNTKVVPRAALLLGTGLGDLCEQIQVDVTIPYEELEGMPEATADHHVGELVLGSLSGVPVIAFNGRLHCYEGH